MGNTNGNSCVRGPFMSMKYLFTAVLLAASSLSFAGGKSSSFEIGLGLGASYYVGELNTFGHFNPNFTHIGFGGIIRRGLNDRHAFRATAYYGKLSGDNSDDIRINSGDVDTYNFTSTLIESNILYEFNFFPFNPFEETSYWLSPFIYLGVGGYYFSPKKMEGGQEVNALSNSDEISSGDEPSSNQINLPFGFGWKVKFSDRVFFCIDYGLRKTFTDYIDGVSSTSGDAANGYTQYGFETNKDWYSVTMATISFRLGRKNTNCWRPASGTG